MELDSVANDMPCMYEDTSFVSSTTAHGAYIHSNISLESLILLHILKYVISNAMEPSMCKYWNKYEYTNTTEKYIAY